MIGGRLSGRRLRSPSGASVRPTSDRVREALFARLGDLAGMRVLDLYAGTGALGIEALSRGAARAVFVERGSGALAALRANLKTLELEASARVVRGDASATARRLGRAGERFDLVLLDPPYATQDTAKALSALSAAGLLEDGGQVVVERSRHHPLPETAGLVILDDRRYGDTVITRLVPTRREAEEADGNT